MFNFLKEKIKQTVEKFSSKTETIEEVEVPIEDSDKEVVQDAVEEPVKEKKGFFSKLFSKKEETQQIEEEKVVEEEPIEVEVEKISKSKEVVEDIPKSTEIIEEKPIKKAPKEKVEVKKEVPVEETVELVEEPLKEKVIEEVKEEPIGIKQKEVKSIEEEKVVDVTQKKGGFFSKLKETFVKFKLDDEKFEEIFWEFELGLMESNVAIEVIQKIKKDLKEKLTAENVSKKDIPTTITNTLREIFDDILSIEGFDLIQKIKSVKHKPYVICMIGVNGSGKTTTLAKFVKLMQKHNLSVVVAASDTFRAAAIHQLEEHTNKLGVKLIKHDYNADPAAVAFDAIKHAKAKEIDVVLIDTAGRLHSNSNLMDELKKVIRISSPDLKIFVGESVTGNDCIEQARQFNEAVGIDGIVLSKADVDENGGAAISVSFITGKPIIYLGTGQNYDDLVSFDKKLILEQIFDK
ncbi:MAG: signal recognition particle-docking protein FtsY [Candidatus Nanoarchaeia archaeon]|nr:signal recognition particle-docking protein FtsY [Candidatus Nanoarchaeia archaeon]